MSHIVGDVYFNPSLSEPRPMTDISRTDDIFYARTGMDPERVGSRVDAALEGADDGELFLEYNQSESITFDDGAMERGAWPAGSRHSPRRHRR